MMIGIGEGVGEGGGDIEMVLLSKDRDKLKKGMLYSIEATADDHHFIMYGTYDSVSELEKDLKYLKADKSIKSLYVIEHRTMIIQEWERGEDGKMRLVWSRDDSDFSVIDY